MNHDGEVSFLPGGELTTCSRLARISTLGALVQRLILDGSPDGKDFAFAVSSVIVTEAEAIRESFEGGGRDS